MIQHLDLPGVAPPPDFGPVSTYDLNRFFFQSESQDSGFNPWPATMRPRSHSYVEDSRSDLSLQDGSSIRGSASNLRNTTETRRDESDSESSDDEVVGFSAFFAYLNLGWFSHHS